MKFLSYKGHWHSRTRRTFSSKEIDYCTNLNQYSTSSYCPLLSIYFRLSKYVSFPELDNMFLDVRITIFQPNKMGNSTAHLHFSHIKLSVILKQLTVLNYSSTL